MSGTVTDLWISRHEVVHATLAITWKVGVNADIPDWGTADFPSFIEKAAVGILYAYIR
jgi:hypothetical protein